MGHSWPMPMLPEHSGELRSTTPRWRRSAWQWYGQWRRGGTTWKLYNIHCLNNLPNALSHAIPEPAGIAACTSKVSRQEPPSFPVDLDVIAHTQKDDEALSGYWKMAVEVDTSCTERIAFEVRQDVLCRQIPSKKQGAQYQLVIPAKLVPSVLAPFHDSPLAGHLGRLKTLLSILEVAWWPMIQRDVWEYVKCCTVCQEYKPKACWDFIVNIGDRTR